MVSVDLKMTLTFPERRADIVTKNIGVGERLQKYPCYNREIRYCFFFSESIIFRQPCYNFPVGGRQTQ